MTLQIDNLQVLDAIVVAVSILVVYVLGWQQRSAQVLLHDHSMLASAVAIDLHLAIGRAALPACFGEAIFRADLWQMDLSQAGARAVFGRADAIGFDPKHLTAIEASDLGAANTSAGFTRITTARRAVGARALLSEKGVTALAAGVLMNGVMHGNSNYISCDGTAARLVPAR